MLPNVLCIGASRSGTTWLDHQLRQHPEVYLPEKRKEVGYFNKYYCRGNDWYENFFTGKDIESLAVVAEISPGYFSCMEAPQRILQTIGDKEPKFIVMLRNPVDRAYSQWAYRVQKRGEKKSFLKYIQTNEEPVRLSLYGKYLSNYMDHFDPSFFHIVFFDDLKEKPLDVLRSLAEFLDISPEFFQNDSIDTVPNASYLPRFGRLYQSAFKVKQYLRKNDHDWLVNSIKSMGVETIFGNRGRGEKLDDNTYDIVNRLFEEDTSHLKNLLNNNNQFTSCSELDLEKLWLKGCKKYNGQ